jgi:hypothetical protein
MMSSVLQHIYFLFAENRGYDWPPGQQREVQPHPRQSLSWIEPIDRHTSIHRYRLAGYVRGTSHAQKSNQR